MVRCLFNITRLRLRYSPMPLGPLRFLLQQWLSTFFVPQPILARKYEWTTHLLKNIFIRIQLSNDFAKTHDKNYLSVDKNVNWSQQKILSKQHQSDDRCSILATSLYMGTAVVARPSQIWLYFITLHWPFFFSNAEKPDTHNQDGIGIFLYLVVSASSCKFQSYH